MKKLPLGIQTFKDIRDKNENYLYVDKTDIALKLIQTGRYFFLSRPRRFGKSLFVDTLKDIFEGRKELFEGLYIYDKWDWDISYPVIKISFGAGVLRDRKDLDKTIQYLIDENQKRLGIQCNYYTDNVKNCLMDLIQKAYTQYKQKVVILVDEYDKPILDNITNEPIATEIRDGLKNIYSVIKDSDQYIKFAFLTGVSKFSKVSLFSGLNNLRDISLVKDYATICGYTHDDVLRSFEGSLDDVDTDELKRWYNGYNFLGEGVYNPYDILLFFMNHKEYRAYWFETGNPAFLIDVLKQNHYFIPDLENIEVTEENLGSFDIDYIKLETLLFQTGYLTIKEVKTIFNRRTYRLNYPNLEVKSALNEHIFEYLLTRNSLKKIPIFEAIIQKDIEQFRAAIYQLFAAIPSDNYRKSLIQNYEGYYASVMYSYLAGLGINCIAEDVTNKGKIDMTLATPDMSQVYIMVFKVVDKTTQTSDDLAQIKAKKYYEKYQQQADEIYLIGITFSKEEKNICQFEWEKIKPLYLEDFPQSYQPEFDGVS